MRTLTASRPAIPAEVVRQILIESGHRCAVCGDGCPLERAHIVPWSKSKKHTIENLVCLCANCHQRADLEAWGESTLKQYKANPWILRKSQDQTHEALDSMLEFTIEMKLAEFKESHKKVLEHSLAAFLNTSPENIKVVAVRSGSVKVTINLSEKSAVKLLEAVEKNDPLLFNYLNPLSVTEVRRVNDTASCEAVPLKTGPSVKETVHSEKDQITPSHGSGKPATRLFVGNLSFNTTENQLQDMFASHGPVSEVNLIMDKFSGRPRGFAFVTMETKEAADAAVQALNGKSVDGRAMTVNEARPREERPSHSSGGVGRGVRSDYKRY